MRSLFLAIALILIMDTHAGYNGNITFSAGEIVQHKDSITALLNYSQACIQRHKEEHEDFYRSHCISYRGQTRCLSKFYGERRYTKKRGARRSDGKRLTYLPKALKDAGFNPSLAEKMEATSCVGLALQCLKEGFQATAQSQQWNKIMAFVRANGVGGTALQHALQQIGWKVYYWNPTDPAAIQEVTKRWDIEERNWQSKGWHNYRYNSVLRKGTYWHNKVDNATDLIGFEKKVPTLLYRYPFWVGIANTGYHVFPGSFEKVVEAHSTRHITSQDNLEFSDFNPLATGGGPRWTSTEKYRSGLIALPPLF